jgi:PhzF family phenazine biosynthesis protein
MNIKIYQVDAFTDKVFAGNPAAICPLDSWLPEKMLQDIAMENNLSETAFYVKEAGGYRLRWFTPTVEVDLCGHATLATAFVMFNFEGFKGDTITFNSRSGPLTVTRKGDLISMNFPVDTLTEVKLTEPLTAGFNYKPVKAFRGRTDYVLIFEDELQVTEMTPDMRLVAKVESRGIIVTAPGREVDFVSRFFGPQTGVDEDPVTGSAHTSLTPYWAGVLKKNKLEARQLSKRGGSMTCTLLGDRVELVGRAKLYMQGNVVVDEAGASKKVAARGVAL